jgi:hypothetical protein
MGVAYDDYSFEPDQEDIVYSSVAENGKTFIRRGDIPAIMRDDFVRDALSEWNRFTRFGLANGAGWKNERILYVRVIEVCEQEHQHTLARMREDQNGQ